MNRWLLEFDVRVAKEQYVSRRWNANARAEYLLRPETEWPLSVDKLVWPSVFYPTNFKSPYWESYSTIEVDPAIEGVGYWLDLDRMRTHYDLHRALAPDGMFVGVELLSEQDADGPTIPYMDGEGHQCGIWLDQTRPERLPGGSSLLGYDVADAGRISGLANCGYTEEEIRDLPGVWAKRLNSFGLLTTLDDAVAFRRVCDERVSEHAPFWVYALWRLPVD